MSGRTIPADVTSERASSLCKQGKTRVTIALELGISRRTVSRLLDPEGTKRRKEWRRINVIHTTLNGKNGWHRVKKRPLPDSCELCNKISSPKLQWHHWDDNHPELGIWVCSSCHYFTEGLEAGLTMVHVEKYLKLKSDINQVSERVPNR